jgi:hypothetical protein
MTASQSFSRLLRTACFALLPLTLAACGGGGGDGGPSQPVVVADTGTFYSSPVQILVGGSNLVGVGRGFVTVNQGVPTAVGLDLAAEAVKQLPVPGFDSPAIYGVALPPESVYTPFTYIAISYWSGHTPQGIGDVPHFHPLFGIYPPQLPDPTFANEIMQPAPEEIPKDHFMQAGSDAVAPGIGAAWQDPIQPQNQAGWDSTGQNYFFYKGHMNDIGLGATNTFLLRQQEGKEPTRSDVIKQPEVYPLPGYYPHRYSVSYDSSRKVHRFVLEDFRKAARVRITQRS